MDAKERTKMGYDLFNKGDMETFFKEMVDENTTWTFPGKEGVHPLSGVHKGPQAMMAAMGKIPALWSNFHLTPIDMIDMIAEPQTNGMFGHYFEIAENGKCR